TGAQFVREDHIGGGDATSMSGVILDAPGPAIRVPAMIMSQPMACPAKPVLMLRSMRRTSPIQGIGNGLLGLVPLVGRLVDARPDLPRAGGTMQMRDHQQVAGGAIGHRRGHAFIAS